MKLAYRVVKPIDVFVRVALVESNTWFGSSRAIGNLFERQTLKRGTLVFDWPGGTFALQRGQTEAFEVRIALSDKHPFEKSYAPYPTFASQWPMESLKQVQIEDSPKTSPSPKTIYTLDALPKGARAFERSIDFVMGVAS